MADRGYYSHEQMRLCAEQAIETYVPMISHLPAGEGDYPLERFVYDAKRDLFLCPQGRELTRHTDAIKPSGRYRIYYAGVAACRDCPVRQQCTRSRYRKLAVHVDREMIEAVKGRLRQRPEVAARRRSLVEHPFGTLKFWLGYHHFLTKGLAMVRAEFSLSCLAYNFRRALNVLGVGSLLRAFQKPLQTA